MLKNKHLILVLCLYISIPQVECLEKKLIIPREYLYWFSWSRPEPLELTISDEHKIDFDQEQLKEDQKVSENEEAMEELVNKLQNDENLNMFTKLNQNERKCEMLSDFIKILPTNGDLNQIDNTSFNKIKNLYKSLSFRRFSIKFLHNYDLEDYKDELKELIKIVRMEKAIFMTLKGDNSELVFLTNSDENNQNLVLLADQQIEDCTRKNEKLLKDVEKLETEIKLQEDSMMTFPIEIQDKDSFFEDIILFNADLKVMNVSLNNCLTTGCGELSDMEFLTKMHPGDFKTDYELFDSNMEKRAKIVKTMEYIELQMEFSENDQKKEELEKILELIEVESDHIEGLLEANIETLQTEITAMNKYFDQMLDSDMYEDYEQLLDHDEIKLRQKKQKQNLIHGNNTKINVFKKLKEIIKKDEQSKYDDFVLLPSLEINLRKEVIILNKQENNFEELDDLVEDIQEDGSVTDPLSYSDMKHLKTISKSLKDIDNKFNDDTEKTLTYLKKRLSTVENIMTNAAKIDIIFGKIFADSFELENGTKCFTNVDMGRYFLIFSRFNIIFNYSEFFRSFLQNLTPGMTREFILENYGVFLTPEFLADAVAEYPLRKSFPEEEKTLQFAQIEKFINRFSGIVQMYKQTQESLDDETQILSLMTNGIMNEFNKRKNYYTNPKNLFMDASYFAEDLLPFVGKIGIFRESAKELANSVLVGVTNFMTDFFEDQIDQTKEFTQNLYYSSAKALGFMNLHSLNFHKELDENEARSSTDNSMFASTKQENKHDNFDEINALYNIRLGQEQSQVLDSHILKLSNNRKQNFLFHQSRCTDDPKACLELINAYKKSKTEAPETVEKILLI